jgi:hypothetical protein
MITAQITIPDQIYESLKRQYGAKGKRPADIIREALVQRAASIGNTKLQNQTLDRLVKLQLKGGPKDLASHLDDYLYGDKA